MTANTENTITIRTAKLADAPAILAIYAYYVEHTAITYEYDVPSLSDFEDRMRHTLEHYPYLVAVENDKIIGYAYASQYHPRAAYGWNAETTIYLDHTKHGHGTGQRLYTLLEQILSAQGVVNAVALITPPRTPQESTTYPSVHFHEKMGYELSGRIPDSGYKFNQWFDTVTMTKRLNEPVPDMQPIKSFDMVREQFAL